MLRVHTSNGLTAKLDLNDEQQARQFLQRASDRVYQDTITGLTAFHHAFNQAGKEVEVQFSLSRPAGFGTVVFDAEPVPVEAERRIKGGERIVCIADDVRLTLMIHREQHAVRISMSKMGRQRYNPRFG